MSPMKIADAQFWDEYRYGVPMGRAAGKNSAGLLAGRKLAGAAGIAF